jgi:hypothetical protein
VEKERKKGWSTAACKVRRMNVLFFWDERGVDG